MNLLFRKYTKLNEILDDLYLITFNCSTYNPNPESLVRKSCYKF
jgi:hypothetical protein